MTGAALLYLALFSLATSMPGYRTLLLGKFGADFTESALRVAGWLSLAASFTLACLAGPATAIVQWFGLLPLLAGSILLSLTYWVVPARCGAAIAALVCVVGPFLR